MKQKADFSFTYEGVTGYVFGNHVQWRGAHFQIEAARPGLRNAIDKGRCANRGGCFGGNCCLK